MIEVRMLVRAELERLALDLPFRPRARHAERLAEQERGEACYLVAWLDGAAVGHVHVRFLAARRSAQARREECVELEDVFVAPAHRRRGAASVLLRAAEEAALARGEPLVGLAVEAGNEAARRLYAAAGYREIGRGAFDLSYTSWGDDGVPRRLTASHLYLTKRAGAAAPAIDRWLPAYDAGHRHEREVALPPEQALAHALGSFERRFAERGFRVLEQTATQWVAGREPGALRVAVDLRAEPAGAGRSLLVTETRIAAAGEGARRRLAVSWALAGPLSALRSRRLLSRSSR